MCAMPRLYLPQTLTHGQPVELPADLVHYCARVLRLANNDEVTLWDGLGHQTAATIDFPGKNRACVTATKPSTPIVGTELDRPIHVLQALPEGDKMDWVLEKSTELGACHFWPVQAQRSVVKLAAQRAEKRLQHWEKVVISACLQSGRGKLPEIAAVDGLRSTLLAILAKHPQAQVLWFTPTATLALAAWCENHLANNKLNNPSTHSGPIVICVGPEGGWSPEETECAIALGAVALRFSGRILRTETFAIACLAQLTAYLGLDREA